MEDETNVPALWLYTRTGVPNNAVIPLLSPKVTLNIKPAVSDPVSVSGDHIDANFAASKVKAGRALPSLSPPKPVMATWRRMLPS